MKRLLLPFFLTLSGVVHAQDRASAEAFVNHLYQAVSVSDDDAVMACLDPTLIYRDDRGILTTYADYKAIADRNKADRMAGKPAPKPSPVTTVTFDRLDIVGNRAFADYTAEIPPERKGARPYRYKARTILVWRDGAWKFWRVEIPRT